jgi:hypothetical protein
VTNYKLQFPARLSLLIAFRRGRALALARIVQILWAIFFVVVIGIRAIASGSALEMLIGSLSVIYLGAALACFANSRIAWIVALALTVLPLLRWTPMIAINFWMFFEGHELYRDSPATIFIVAINAIVFVLPGLLIYICCFVDRKRLFAVLRAPVSIGDGVSSANTATSSTRDANPYSPPRI